MLLQRARQEGPDEIGPAEVRGALRRPARLVPDFIALRGDPSDGLPGAKGIGEKTAADLLRRHGSLEAVIGAARCASEPAVRRALIEQADELRVFKDIATLRTHESSGRPTADATGRGAPRRASGASSGWRPASPTLARPATGAAHGVNLTVMTSPSAIT